MRDAEDAVAEPVGREDSSTDRTLRILDLFTVEQPIWTTEEFMETLGVARATMYRYLRKLVEAGFLSADGGGTYMLGPRFIELDRQLRLADPLLQVAPPVMQSIRPGFGGDMILCRSYGRKVVTILEDRFDPRIKPLTHVDRGSTFTMFLGSPSKIILANLTQMQQQRLFLHHSEEIAAAGLGRNWNEFREGLKVISGRGYAIANDIDKLAVGISGAIFMPSGEPIGSICLIRVLKEVDEAEFRRLGELARTTAAKITSLLGKRLAVVTGKENSASHKARGAPKAVRQQVAKTPSSSRVVSAVRRRAA